MKCWEWNIVLDTLMIRVSWSHCCLLSFFSHFFLHFFLYTLMPFHFILSISFLQSFCFQLLTPSSSLLIETTHFFEWNNTEHSLERYEMEQEWITNYSNLSIIFPIRFTFLPFLSLSLSPSPTFVTHWITRNLVVWTNVMDFIRPMEEGILLSKESRWNGPRWKVKGHFLLRISNIQVLLRKEGRIHYYFFRVLREVRFLYLSPFLNFTRTGLEGKNKMDGRSEKVWWEKRNSGQEGRKSCWNEWEEVLLERVRRSSVGTSEKKFCWNQWEEVLLEPVRRSSVGTSEKKFCE